MYWIHYYHIYMHMYDGILSSIQRARKLYIYSFLLLSYAPTHDIIKFLLCRDLYYTLTKMEDEKYPYYYSRLFAYSLRYEHMGKID